MTTPHSPAPWRVTQAEAALDRAEGSNAKPGWIIKRPAHPGRTEAEAQDDEAAGFYAVVILSTVLFFAVVMFGAGVLVGLARPWVR